MLFNAEVSLFQAGGSVAGVSKKIGCDEETKARWRDDVKFKSRKEKVRHVAKEKNPNQFIVESVITSI